MASRPGTPRGHSSRPGTPRGHSSRPGTPHGHTSPSPLSIRHFNSIEEYMSVIRNGLSDWLNSLYDLNLTPDDLVECLSTGVVLCHHANTWEVESGTDHRVHFSPRAAQGSFQARDNVSLFIDWCRHSLQFPETLLFETNDLVEGRNEHNFLVGLPEPVFDLPEMCVEKFATGPLSSIQLSYSGKKVPPTESKRDSPTTRQSPPVHRRGGEKNGHPSTDRSETERPRTRPHQRAASSDGTPAGNDVSPDKATGNNVMMVVRDSRGKHTVLRDRTEPVDLQAKNYQLVCADTVELPTNQDTRDRDAKLHVMAAIPNMEAKPGDDVFVKRAATNSEFVAQREKSCPVHGRSSSLDDVDLAHGQLPHAPKEKTSRTARRWSDGFQTQRIVGRRDSGKSPSERVLSKVNAKSSGHFESPFMQSDRQVSSPRRGSLGCSVCPRHSDAEQPESLESFWERLSRPKTRRKSLPSGLPTVSETVPRPRPKSADARLHMRRGTFPINSSKEQLSISPRGYTKNGYPSTDKNESERPRTRPGSAMAKLGGPASPPQRAREKERPLSARYTMQKTQDDHSVKTQNRKETAEERNRTGGLPNGDYVKERTSISPKSIRGRNAFPDRPSNEPESPRPRPRSAMAKLERPSSPPQNASERDKRSLAGRIAKEMVQNIPSDIKKEVREERNRTSSFPNKERTSISPRSNTESVTNFPSPKPRPRSAMGKLEATISPPGENVRPLNIRTPKEKTTPSFAADSSRKEALAAERNGSGKGGGRIPLERANSFVIKEKSAQNEAWNRTANHHRETTSLSAARSKSLPLIDEVFDNNKRQESFTFGGTRSTRPTDTSRSMSESFKQNNSYYSSSIAISDHTSHGRTVAGGSHERRRVSDSCAVVGRHRTEVDREVYEDFLKEVNGRKKQSPAAVDHQVTTTVNRQISTTAKTYNSNAYIREKFSGQNHEAEGTDSSSSCSGDDTSHDTRRSSLRPCTPVPSDHKLPRTVSPRQDPVPWPPSKIPRPTFYAEQEEEEGPVSPSACSNAKNLQDFLDYLHTSNALQRADSLSLTSDSSEGSTLI
ncbi:cytoskeletal adaptor [Branchiostoma belcheri]|nr:cytoskeletal adaptor [Branchiostoma belcheri]